MPKITIQPGNTLSGIAQEKGTTVQKLLQLNPNITNPDLIFAGATLNIPDATQPPTIAQGPTLVTTPQATSADLVRQIKQVL